MHEQRQATPWPLEGGPSAALRASFLSCSWRWPCRPLCCKTRAQCQFSSQAFRSSARCCCNFFSSSSSRACSPRATHLPFCSPNTKSIPYHFQALFHAKARKCAQFARPVVGPEKASKLRLRKKASRVQKHIFIHSLVKRLDARQLLCCPPLYPSRHIYVRSGSSAPPPEPPKQSQASGQEDWSSGFLFRRQTLQACKQPQQPLPPPQAPANCWPSSSPTWWPGTRPTTLKACPCSTHGK